MQLNGMKSLVDLFRLEQEIQRAKLQNQNQYALQLYDQVINLKSQLPNRFGLAKTVAEKAFLLEQCGYYREALQSFQIAANITKSSPNQEFSRYISQQIDTLSNRLAF
jgi:tetratricopeptide (TPR) repeat protein